MAVSDGGVLKVFLLSLCSGVNLNNRLEQDDLIKVFDLCFLLWEHVDAHKGMVFQKLFITTLLYHNALKVKAHFSPEGCLYFSIT